MQINIRVKITENFALVMAMVIIVVTPGIVFLVLKNRQNPIPTTIRQQASYKLLYPATHEAILPAESFKYQTDSNVLSYTAQYAGTNIAFSEQPTPDDLGSDTQDYYTKLNIHPYAQFKTNQGQVALAKFWQSGNLKPFGQSAFMVSDGTMLTAHSDKELTNQQWKSLFETIKIAR